ncbi:MAG TPA: glycosyltransferase [Bdellovibrionota bacterium]|nr:glycosyltransferase [Bdellovibrionota bacterium]
MTWLFPVISRLVSPSLAGGAIRSRKTSPAKLPSIAVLIPAHDEESSIRRTLRSVEVAIAAARRRGLLEDAKIIVGADGCTDSTARVARSLGAEVIESREKSGKWKSISRLIRSAQGADWVILADAGIVWPRHFLLEALPLMADPALVSIAPTYRAPSAGALETLVWNVERHFKSLEVPLGGPISIHGATVCYRRRECLTALRHLGPKAWLNDDVVLPLTLRALFPALRIHYLASVGVYDDLGSGHARASREFGRRRRMVYGNLQWIHGLLPAVFERNSAAALLALRRAFRVLWAYWGLALVAGTAALLDPFIVQVGFALGLAGAVSLRGPFVRLWDSARASWLAPFYFFSVRNLGGVVWK